MLLPFLTNRAKKIEHFYRCTVKPVHFYVSTNLKFAEKKQINCCDDAANLLFLHGFLMQKDFF